MQGGGASWPVPESHVGTLLLARGLSDEGILSRCKVAEPAGGGDHEGGLRRAWAPAPCPCKADAECGKHQSDQGDCHAPSLAGDSSPRAHADCQGKMVP